MVNVISYINALKSRYGENHWFWAVWIDVEPIRQNLSWDWNGDEPTAQGFCSSKSKARSAAWGAVRSFVAEKEDQRAYRLGWAYNYLWKKQEEDKRPYFSRCKISRNKWLWVACSNDGIFDDEEPLNRGFVTTPEEAEEAARTAVGPVQKTGNWLADHYRQKQAAIKRKQRKSDSKAASSFDFVYHCDQGWVMRHRIVKTTKKRLYVDELPYHENAKPSGNWRDFVQKTFILDREEIEKTGKAQRRGRYYGFYYRDPEFYYAEQNSTSCRPDCFVGLGVAANATRKEIQQAYRRLARKTHPDAGGNAMEFKQVQSWYEQALVLVG